MKRLTGLLLLCTMLLSMFMPLCAFAQAAPPTVTAVEVTGLKNVMPEFEQEVENIIASLTGAPLDQARIDEAVEKIEALGVFFSASVSQASVDNGVKLTIHVVENKIISSIQFVGNVSFTDAQLFALIKNQAGQVLNDNFALQDQQAVQEYYYRAGYVYTEVAAPSIKADPAEPSKIILTFEVFEPRIGEIRIDGARKTRESEIRKRLAFKVGDVVNINAQQESLRNLTAMGAFETATVTYGLGTQPNTLVAIVKVVERSTGTASVGVTQSQVEGITGFVSLSENNLFGTGQRLSGNVRFGGDTGYQLSYTNPWIDARRTSATLNLYNFATLREAFVGDQSSGASYDEKRTGADLSFSRPIQRDTRVSLGLRANNIRTTPDSSITDQQIRDILLQDYDVRSVSLGFIRDTRNYPLSAYAGSYTAFETEAAGLGGSNFFKLTGEARRYFVIKEDTKAVERVNSGKLPHHLIFASRVKAGTSTGVPPFLDQFFVGGSDTLRGYKQDRFPGTNLLLWNNELRVPINDTLSVVGFADIGDAWGGKIAEELGDRSFELHYGYGIGLRLLLPAIGPLRLDYGINDAGNAEFTFAFGSTF